MISTLVRVKQRFVTLVEVVIALGLLMVLMGALITIYGNLLGTESILEKKKVEGFSLRYLETRLNGVMTSTLCPKEENILFYTDNPLFSPHPSLVFMYDNGANINPQFSCSVLGRLFVDHEGKLLLVTWPDPERYEGRESIQEVLVEGVTDLKFRFFVPKNLDAKIETEEVGVEKSTPIWANPWPEVWEMSYKKVPPLVKIVIERAEKEPITFIFHLASNSYQLEVRE